MTFPGRIRRGPMAADILERRFVQIHNAVFRDPRISFKAKGLFGLIASHRDGFGISEESISVCGTDGLASVRSGLQELIEVGYLRRTRTRDSRGRLGASEYYITDMPDGLVLTLNPDWDAIDEPEPQNASSEPGCENSDLDGEEQKPSSEPGCDSPSVDSPGVGSPGVENPRGKKTSSKKTKGKEPPSQPPPGDTGHDDTGGGREEDPAAAPPRPPTAPHDAVRAEPGSASERAQRIASAALEAVPMIRARRAAAIAARIEQVLALGADPDLLTEYLTMDMTGVRSIAAVVEHRLAPEQLPPGLFSPAQPAKKEWCGAEGCDPVMRTIETTKPDGSPYMQLCPACHPRATANTPAPF